MKWKMIASDDGSDEGSFWINNESFRDSCPWDSTFSDRSMAAMTVRGESPSRPKPAEREKHGSSSHRIGSFEHSRHGSDSAIAFRLPHLCNWPVFQMSTMIIGSRRQQKASVNLPLWDRL